jgi:serine/threonine protein phosphatase PrpC
MSPVGASSLLCAVIDGYCGSVACSILAAQLVPHVERELAARGSRSWEDVFKHVFRKLNIVLFGHRECRLGQASMTVTLVTESEIVTANVGNCMAYLRNQSGNIELATMHTLLNATDAEIDVIKRTRFFKIKDGSLFYGETKLKIVRSLGESSLIDVPSVNVRPRSEEDEFIVLTSGGIEKTVETINEYMQLAICMFNKDTIMHIPHFLNTNLQTDENVSSCVLFLRRFEDVRRDPKYSVDKDYQLVHICVWQMLANKERVFYDTSRTNYTSRYGNCATAITVPDDFVKEDHVFSQSGDLVAVHRSPFIRDPGWKRFMTPSVASQIHENHAILAFVAIFKRKEIRMILPFDMLSSIIYLLKTMKLEIEGYKQMISREEYIDNILPILDMARSYTTVRPAVYRSSLRASRTSAAAAAAAAADPSQMAQLYTSTTRDPAAAAAAAAAPSQMAQLYTSTTRDPAAAPDLAVSSRATKRDADDSYTAESSRRSRTPLSDSRSEFSARMRPLEASSMRDAAVFDFSTLRRPLFE